MTENTETVTGASLLGEAETLLFSAQPPIGMTQEAWDVVVAVIRTGKHMVENIETVTNLLAEAEHLLFSAQPPIGMTQEAWDVVIYDWSSRKRLVDLL